MQPESRIVIHRMAKLVRRVRLILISLAVIEHLIPAGIAIDAGLVGKGRKLCGFAGVLCVVSVTVVAGRGIACGIESPVMFDIVPRARS